ncbi:MAG TPA: porin, partial [Pirellulales bacterium]
VSNNPIGFRAYSLSYEFSRALEVSIGQSKVPGTREWLESGFAPLEGPDRSMATTFFRPSLSQGIWIKGQPLDGVYYHGMMSNGYNTLNVNPRQFSNRFCWSGSAWWEPWGDFGGGYADWENHPEPVIRLGTSATLAIDQGIQSNDGGVENSLVRLSDGTNITQTGAFAAGATLQTYDVSLLAIDAAYKWRGASLSTEWYAQEISSLIADAALPINSTHAQGGFVQGGYFVRPQSVEIYSRASFVTGRYGSGTEQAAGLNWFVFPGQSNLRCTFDAAWLESSPASQNRTGYVAGQTGLLVRTQVSASY